MSKLYKRYLSLKKLNPSVLYLFKNGIFYIFLDEDAKKMSPLLNLKLTNLNETILKCGFPINNLDKYSKLINNAGYELKVVDSSSQETYSSKDFILNSKIKDFINKLSNIDSNSISISEAYSFIEHISKQAKEFVKEMNYK